MKPASPGFDDVIGIARAHNIYVFIDPMETIGWLQTLRNNGLTSAHEFGRYLGRRYKTFALQAQLFSLDYGNCFHVSI